MELLDVAKESAGALKNASELTLDGYTTASRQDQIMNAVMLVSAVDARPLSWASTPATKQMFSILSNSEFIGASHTAVANRAMDFWRLEVRCRCGYYPATGLSI